MSRKYLAVACLAVAVTALTAGIAVAQDTIKVGIVAPMTGTSARSVVKSPRVPISTWRSMAIWSPARRSS